MNDDNLSKIAERASLLVAEDFAEYGYENPPAVSVGIVRAVLNAKQSIDEDCAFTDGLDKFIMYTEVGNGR